MLAFAKKERANDGGNNHTKYGRWYGDDGVPWCAQFVSYVFARSGQKLPSLDARGKGFEYVPTAIAYARAHHQLSSHPRAGDIFMATDGHHAGIVSTIEGNAGPATDRVVHGSRRPGNWVFWTAIRP